MKILTPAISVALFLVTIPSLAAEPPSPTASAAPAAAPVTQAPKAPAAAASSDPAAIAKAAHSLGYKSRQLNGKTVYCKTEAAAGSRLNSTTCLTEEQVTAAGKRSEENKDSINALQRAAPSNQPYMGMSGHY
jgi:hypothetical protein